MASYKVGYFVGSLSSKSINRRLALALAGLAPPELELSEIPIRDLPMYSPDHDAAYPPVAQAFKQAIADCDAVLFVTPEYNRSIPGCLKNAIDWASRPWGQNAFTNFIYQLSRLFVAPFLTMVDPIELGTTAMFEIASVLAIIFYLIFAWLLVRLMILLFNRPASGVSASRSVGRQSHL